MKRETVLFFQELYQNSVLPDKILAFCMNTQGAELQKEEGFFDRTIFLSKRARKIKMQVEILKKQVTEIKMPGDILSIQEELEELKETTQSFLMHSMKNLERNVFLPDDLDTVFLFFDQYAADKIERMYRYTIYYALCQNGSTVKKYLDLCNGITNESEYKSKREFEKWENLLQFIESEKIVLWKYRQKLIRLDSLGEVSQFVLVEQEKLPDNLIPGRPEISFGNSLQTENVQMDINGKGNITNFDPEFKDLCEKEVSICYDKDLNVKDDRIFEINFNENPINVLNIFFKEKLFVISAEAYFRFANSCMIFQRLGQIFGK